MRISREQMAMEWAHTASKRGTCGRLAVGAIIVKGSRPISAGYVGAPAGEPHCDEVHCDMSKPCTRTTHAEVNAIKFAQQRDIEIQGADMFVTDSPCIFCAQKIVEAGIDRVYYDRAYRDLAGVSVLLNGAVQVFQILANGMVREIKA